MRGWLLGLVQAGIGVGMMTALLSLLDKPLRRRMPASWFCAVWLALTVRLLLPLPLPGLVRFPLPQGMQTALVQEDGAKTAVNAGREDGPHPDMDAAGAGRSDAEEGLPASQAGEPAGEDGRLPDTAATRKEPDDPTAGDGGWLGWMFGIWAAGAAVTLAGQLGSGITLYETLRRWGADPGEAVRRSAAREAAALGVRRVPRLVQSEEGPLVAGMARPILALPAGLEDGEGTGDLGLILRHELAHVRRHDLAFKALLAAARALHWFNPLVWWMAGRASAEMELACDDLALRNASDTQRRVYGEAVLAMALRNRNGRWAPMLSTGFRGGKRRMRRRFENLAAGPAGRRRALGLGLVLAALLLAGSWTLGAVTAGAAQADPAQPASAGGWGTGDSGAASSAQGEADPAAPDAAEGNWQQTVVDFARNSRAGAAPVMDAGGEQIVEMRCALEDAPAGWQPEEGAVRMSLLLPEGWTVRPAAEGEEIYASGAGTQAPFNLTDENGAWVGTMQYGTFSVQQLGDAFYGSGKHAAYFWLWAKPQGFGWDEESYRAAAGDAMLDDPTAAGAALCETVGRAQAGHEGILAHDGTLGRFVAIELREGVLSEPERMRMAQSIRLMAGDPPVDAVPELEAEPSLPAGYVWCKIQLEAAGGGRATVRLALPEDCELCPDVPETASDFGPQGAGAQILRGDETVGRIECSAFASPAPVDWPVENPRQLYADRMLSAHMGWDFDYQEIARSGSVSIATCLVGREAEPQGPGPKTPPAGQEPENFRDGWWYQKGILCADNTLGLYAAIELEYGAFSDTVWREIAQSVRLAAEE